MENDRTIICNKHEYCEDCPCRSGCPIRPTFYKDKSFRKALNKASVKSIIFLIAHGFSQMEANLIVKESRDNYEKKRIQETLSHPTYSEE